MILVKCMYNSDSIEIDCDTENMFCYYCIVCSYERRHIAFYFFI